MVPSYDMDVTADFLVKGIGFQLVYTSDIYRILEKDGLTVHLLRAGEDIGQMEFYLEVDDVDAVWAALESMVSTLKVKAPFDQPYRMREAHIELPATKTLMFIGQSL